MKYGRTFLEKEQTRSVVQLDRWRMQRDSAGIWTPRMMVSPKLKVETAPSFNRDPEEVAATDAAIRADSAGNFRRAYVGATRSPSPTRSPPGPAEHVDRVGGSLSAGTSGSRLNERSNERSNDAHGSEFSRHALAHGSRGNRGLTPNAVYFGTKGAKSCADRGRAAR